MKTLYITAFFLLSLNIYAQENKNSEQQDNIEHIKKSKEFENKMMNEAQENSNKKPSTPLASEQGLEVKEKQKVQPAENNSGKLLPSTASMEEILATIPGRSQRKSNSGNPSTVKGLPNTATLEEIKKTIPRN